MFLLSFVVVASFSKTTIILITDKLKRVVREIFLSIRHRFQLTKLRENKKRPVFSIIYPQNPTALICLTPNRPQCAPVSLLHSGSPVSPPKIPCHQSEAGYRTVDVSDTRSPRADSVYSVSLLGRERRRQSVLLRDQSKS